MNTKNKKKEINSGLTLNPKPYTPVAGLTLIEILIVLAIIGLLAALVSGSLANFNTVQSLQTAGSNAASLIARAQSESVAGTGGVPHGVRIATTTFSLFSGSAYATSSVTNTLTFTRGVAVASRTIAGGGSDIIFDQITGATAEPATIVLQVGSNAAYQKTITVSATGVVSVQ